MNLNIINASDIYQMAGQELANWLAVCWLGEEGFLDIRTSSLQYNQSIQLADALVFICDGAEDSHGQTQARCLFSNPKMYPTLPVFLLDENNPCDLKHGFNRLQRYAAHLQLVPAILCFHIQHGCIDVGASIDMIHRTKNALTILSRATSSKCHAEMGR